MHEQEEVQNVNAASFCNLNVHGCWESLDMFLISVFSINVLSAVGYEH